MKKLFGYIKLLLTLKDVQKTYKEEKGTDRPKWLSRGVRGGVLVFLGLFLGTVFGVKLDQAILDQLKNNLDQLVDGLWALKPVIISLYGVIMLIAKIIKETKKSGA